MFPSSSCRTNVRSRRTPALPPGEPRRVTPARNLLAAGLDADQPASTILDAPSEYIALLPRPQATIAIGSVRSSEDLAAHPLPMQGETRAPSADTDAARARRAGSRCLATLVTVAHRLVDRIFSVGCRRHATCAPSRRIA
jgi:hypothetical protein